MLPFILTVIFIVALCIFTLLENKAQGYQESERFGAFAILSLVLLIVHSILWILCLFVSFRINSSFIAYEKNLNVLYTTAQKMNEFSVVSARDDKIIGLENMHQSTNASKALETYSLELVRYNKDMAFRKMVLGNIWLRFYTIKLPKEMGMRDFGEEVK